MDLTFGIEEEFFVVHERTLLIEPQAHQQFIARAAELAGLLFAAKDEFELLVIQITSKANAPWTCNLRTTNGSLIRWGTFGGAGESAAVQYKLNRLRMVAHSRWKLEGPTGGKMFYDLTAPGDSQMGLPLSSINQSSK